MDLTVDILPIQPRVDHPWVDRWKKNILCNYRRDKLNTQQSKAFPDHCLRLLDFDKERQLHSLANLLQESVLVTEIPALMNALECSRMQDLGLFITDGDMCSHVASGTGILWRCVQCTRCESGKRGVHLLTLTWKTSSFPPTLNWDSNRTVNFSSVTDSAPRRSERLILFND